MYVVKIDRITAVDLLPMLMTRGIFKADNILQTDELINDKQSKKEQKEILKRQGIYKWNDYVIRDCRNYRLCVRDTEDFDNISLYKLGYKTALYILSEVYLQKRIEKVVLKKKNMREYLGGTSKSFYEHIKKIIYSLSVVDYMVPGYICKPEQKKKCDKNERLGPFISNLKEDRRTYTVDVNPAFAGCVSFLIIKGRVSKKSLKRGYFKFPMETIKDLSKRSVCLLTVFLLAEKGNSKLNGNKYKVVAQRARKFTKVMRIKERTDRDKYKEFIRALKETKIISKTKPPIEELGNRKNALDAVVRLYVKRSL